MKRLVVLLGITCLALLLVGSCGKQEESTKAQKPAGLNGCPTKRTCGKAPEAKPGEANPPL